MAITQRLNSFPAWMVYPETLELMKALSISGVDAPRFVGGCVRDSLVNRSVCDIDIATPLKPEQMIDCLVKANIKYVPTGIEHGTITAIINKMPFEITTLRKDIETDGRHAKVSFTDNWEEDAARRDFTMNALFCDIDGNIYDYFDGVSDLHNGIVKFIGSAEDRIKEDILRILRFFRFFAHYGREPVDDTALKACSIFANKIPNLSKERITNEFLRLLESKQAPLSCKYMLEAGVMTEIITGDVSVDKLESLIALEQICYTSHDNIRSLVALSCGDIPLFRLSKAQKTHRNILINSKDILPDTSEIDLRRMVHDLGRDITLDMILLSGANNIEYKNDYKNLYQMATACRIPKFQLIGGDVLALGIGQGKQVGEILKTVEKWWADDNFTAGRTECLMCLKEAVDNKTIKAGVIGWPIEHSLSPKLHGYWLEKYNILGKYKKIPVPKGMLEETLNNLRDKGYAGCNITIPYKEDAFKLMDSLDDTAKAIGAVNTVVIDENKKFHGINTDAYGFIQNLYNTVPDWQAKDTKAIILGAGGASRAVLYALIQSGVPEIYILNRTLEKAQLLAEDFKIGNNCTIYAKEWSNDYDLFESTSLLINTTSLGMNNNSGIELDIISKLPKTAIVYDLVYTPLYTKLLKDAEDKGCKIVTGIGMLINQAIPAFKKWFNKKPEIDNKLIGHLKNDK